MRIAFLNPSSELGGAERCLLDMLASLRATSSELDLHLIAAGNGPLHAEATALGIPTHPFHFPSSLAQLGDSGWQGQRFRAIRSLVWRGFAAAGSFPGTLRSLNRLLQKIRPDIVHSNGIKTHLLSAALRYRPVGMVWHVHDFYSRRAAVASLLRWAARRANLAIAVSRAAADDARHTLRQLPVETVLNAVDLEEFSPGAGDGDWLDQQAGLAWKGDFLRVGLVATFGRWKGHDVFLDAAGRLLRDSPALPLCFTIVGGPIYQTTGSQWTVEELRSHAGDLCATNRLGFVGFQVQPARVYRALDIVVHASTQPEPFGRTIAEAMACGRPVIVSAAGGAVELFTPEHDAIGIPPGDSAALAAAIARLAADSALRHRLGIQARQTALERFNRDRLGPQLLDIYRRLLKENRHATEAKP